jgi:hypothetical protein
MVEYLNAEMETVEVFGLELQVFGERDDQLVLVPRLIGQTQALAGEKGRSELVSTWMPEEFRAAYDNLPDSPSRTGSARCSTGRHSGARSWTRERRIRCSGFVA